MRVLLPAQALAQAELTEAMGRLPDDVVLTPWTLDGALPEAAADVELLVLAPPYRDRLVSDLPALRALRVVQTLNAGIDWVPSLPDGVMLCNASGVHDGPVAEWVVAVVAAMQKRLPHFVAEAARGHWDHTANLAFADGIPARDLAGSRVLLVGHGSIGRRLAPMLTAMGMEVTGVARHARDRVAGPEQLPGLLGEADVVVLLAPATAETAGMVDADFLSRMRHGALLVNASRGSLVDHDALLAALHDGRVRAVLDATDPEPLHGDHPLWRAPGVLITPHVAGSSGHWMTRAYQLVGDQIRRLDAGEALENERSHGY